MNASPELQNEITVTVRVSTSDLNLALIRGVSTTLKRLQRCGLTINLGYRVCNTKAVVEGDQQSSPFEDWTTTPLSESYSGLQ